MSNHVTEYLEVHSGRVPLVATGGIHVRRGPHVRKGVTEPCRRSGQDGLIGSRGFASGPQQKVPGVMNLPGHKRLRESGPGCFDVGGTELFSPEEDVAGSGCVDPSNQSSGFGQKGNGHGVFGTEGHRSGSNVDAAEDCDAIKLMDGNGQFRHLLDDDFQRQVLGFDSSPASDNEQRVQLDVHGDTKSGGRGAEQVSSGTLVGHRLSQEIGQTDGMDRTLLAFRMDDRSRGGR